MIKVNPHTIGLDIDGILADFMAAWNEVFPEIPARPNEYDYDTNLIERIYEMKDRGVLDDFYLKIKPLIHPKDLPFIPKAYVTLRPVKSEITAKWLSLMGYPDKKVYTVPYGSSKVEVMREAGIETFVEDYHKNFKELNDAGILTFLLTAPWNDKYDAGDLRIESLDDIKLL